MGSMDHEVQQKENGGRLMLFAATVWAVLLSWQQTTCCISYIITLHTSCVTLWAWHTFVHQSMKENTQSWLHSSEKMFSKWPSRRFFFLAQYLD